MAPGEAPLGTARSVADTEGGGEADALVPGLAGPSRPPAIPRVKSNTGLLRDRWGAQRRLLCASAVLASAGCIAYALFATSSRDGRRPRVAPIQQKFLPSCQTHGGVPACPAIRLLDRTEVRSVATENLMVVGREILGETPQSTVAKIIDDNFRNASTQLQEGAPKVSIELQMTQLTDVEKDSVITCLQLLRNRRVQKLGLHIARAIRGCPSKDPSNVRAHIERLLKPLLGEIRRLRDELIPIPVRQLWGQGHAWELTLDLGNIHIMNRAPTGPLGSLAPLGDFDRIELGLKIGAVEQSRMLLDLLRLSAKVMSKQHIPVWRPSLKHLASTKDLACELAQVELNMKDPLKAWYCLLKFGGQGIDALRAVTGMSDVPLPMNL